MRVIYHVDVNSAFLSWEATYRLHHLGGTLDLRNIPSAVGGDQEKRHGIILAKSIPAKKFHIITGESVAEAKQKCPNLVLVPPNYELYNRSSRAFIEILKRYSDKIEQYSIDEAFVDMTGCTSTPLETAIEIKGSIYKELGFTVNIGVSSNKLLAKMASDFTKPNQVHTLWQNEIKGKMWQLPVRDLFFVGNVSEKKLKKLGIYTIGELAETDIELLKSHLKSHGVLLHQYANGIDESEVITIPPENKGYGNSLTTARDVYTAELAKQYLLSLAETVSARIRADGVKIKVVSVGIRDYDLKYASHQCSLCSATDLTRDIYNAACRCFDELWQGIPIRHLGIHTSQVTKESVYQINLFEKVDYDKMKCMERTVDSLRKRYGQDVIKRAVFLMPKEKSDIYIDHMGGGISREKRTVDYTKENIL